MTTDRVFNFSAGPAVLPVEVVQELREGVLDLDSTGIGILEHSHRSDVIVELFQDTELRVRTIADVPDDYEVLFLSGGASTQFFMVPMNVVDTSDLCEFVITGPWSQKALVEAQRFAATRVIASGADDAFRRLPEIHRQSDITTYLHYTSNETIYGTQFRSVPMQAEIVVCDACSDLFTRPISISEYGVVYASAQKNLGVAGISLVIIRKDLIEAGCYSIPAMLQYRTHRDANSRFNTPPVFAVFALNRMLRWIQRLGGLPAMAQRNREKSELLYQSIDSSQWFTGFADSDSRSQVTVTFTTGQNAADDRFVKLAQQNGLVNLRGHRSSGGLRASLYNSVSIEAVEALVAAMGEFEDLYPKPLQ